MVKMEGSEGYQAVQQKISAQLIATTRSAGQLAAEDLDFLRASDKKAGKRVDRKNRELLDLAQQLIATSTQGTPIPAPELKKPGQIDESWQAITDVIDNLLERADRCLDEYTGVITKLSKDREAAIQERSKDGRREGRAPRVHPLEKPQLRFRRVPRNDETTAFKPLLKTKPHATVSLEDSLKLVDGQNGMPEYQHPYEQEIGGLKYPSSVYLRSEPIPANDDPEGKTLTWVDTPEKVVAMLQELKRAKEIAVDLEHHETHSYVGLVSLMQISTREKDWIVDTLKPWREDLQVLNEVFANPNILKVFHGSTMDMIWLQRDLGLYVVGLFDTYHATNALRYPRHGLAYLLKRFEDFDAQKQYQMADWRTRPLSQEMIQYARSDTHFLLHIYDCIRNELVENSTPEESLVDYVLEKSKAEALQRYERSFYDAEKGFGPNGWLGLLLRTPAILNSEQFAVYKAVHQLRDRIARATDESLLAVMRNDSVFAIARAMPEQMPDLISTVHPISQFLQPKMSELLGVVRSAKAAAVAAGADALTSERVLNDPDVLAYQERSGLLRGRRRADKKAARSTAAAATPSLAEVIRKEREKAEQPANVAESSAFWGPTLDVGQRLAELTVDVRLSLPLPAFEGSGKGVVEKISAAGDRRDGARNGTGSESAKSVVQSSVASETFTIKGLKQASRKRKLGEEQMSGDADDVVSEDVEVMEGEPTQPVSSSERTSASASASTSQDEARAAKARRKAERRAEKEAKQQALETEAPFDYVNAADVSTAPGSEQGGGGGGSGKKKGKKKTFDPYAKALDTPKGLPRRNAGGTVGRSGTFRN